MHSTLMATSRTTVRSAQHSTTNHMTAWHAEQERIGKKHSASIARVAPREETKCTDTHRRSNSSEPLVPHTPRDTRAVTLRGSCRNTSRTCSAATRRWFTMSPEALVHTASPCSDGCTSICTVDQARNHAHDGVSSTLPTTVQVQRREERAINSVTSPFAAARLPVSAP